MGAGEIIGLSAAEAINGAVNYGLSQGATREARLENFEYNEMSADTAQRRQWQTLNKFYTPQAQIRQLKEAGLSPSLMYGQGGATGQTVAPQGAGAQGLQMSVPELLSLAQIRALDAQANLQNAQANTENGDNARGQLELGKLFAEKGLIEEQTKLTTAQTTEQDFTNRVNSATEPEQIEKIIIDTQTAEENYYSALWTAKTNEINFEITQETKDAAIKEAQNRAELLFTQALKTQKDIQLEDAQIKKLGEEVRSIVYQRSLEYFDRQVYQHEVNSQISWRNNQAKLMAKELEMKAKQFNISMDFEKFKLGVEAKVDIFQSCMSAAGMSNAGSVAASFSKKGK